MPAVAALTQASTGRYAIPRLRRGALRRARLLNQLHDGIGNGLIVVQAPAGYGKSSLLAQFATELDYRICWLTLDASSNVPEVFADQLASAIRQEERQEAMAAPVSRPEDLRVHVMSAVVGAVESSNQPLLLVLDNMHEMASGESAALLDWLIDSLPDGMEVILSGRTRAPLAAAEGRVASGESPLMTSGDLAFTIEEVAQLAKNGAEMAFTPQAVMSATHGWPAAVMGLLAGSIALPSHRKPASGSAWERYFTTEIWESIPAHLRGAMLRVGLMPVIERETALLVVGPREWQELSGWLEAHEFLYEALGPASGQVAPSAPSVEDGIIRLNPLLRQFLCAHFEETQPGSFVEVAELLTAQLESQGRVADALELIRDAGRPELAAGLLERHAPELIREGAFALLARGFDALDDSILQQNPLLAGIQTRVLAHVGRPKQAIEAAGKLFANPDAVGAARVHALLGRARALRLTGRHDELKDVFQLVHTIQGCDDPQLIAELTFHEADFALNVTRDTNRAEELLAETSAMCGSERLSSLGLLALSTLGQLYGFRGDGPAMVNTLTQAAKGWRQWGKTANLSWVLNNLAMGHLIVGDFESAVEALREARAQGQLYGNARNVAYATASLGEAELGLGHFDQARQLFEDATRMLADDVTDASLSALCVAGIAGAMLGMGDVIEADYFAERAMLIAEDLENPYELGICRLQQASVKSAANQHAAAMTGGQQAADLFESIEAKSNLRLAYYRLALFCFRANHKAEAQQALRKVDDLTTEPWMVGMLLPEIRQNPMFAQWAASRGLAGRAFRELLEQQPFAAAPELAPEPASTSKFPRVVVRALGQMQVHVGGREVGDEDWASARARELFYLFLTHPEGLRKEEAVEMLAPEAPSGRANSVFHSNLYRLRKALYQESIVKRHGAYMLNPEAEFESDISQFEETADRAGQIAAGSDERAAEYQRALAFYKGPFAEAFYSEWAATVRHRLAGRADEAFSVLAGYHAARDEFEDAAGCMERILRGNPYNEEAAFELANYRLAAGQASAALRFLDDFRRTYEDELGEDLPTRFGDLRTAIAAGGNPS